MSMIKQKAYERLKVLHDESRMASYAWTSSGKLTEWTQNVQSALRRLYGDKSEHLIAFLAVRCRPSTYY